MAQDVRKTLVVLSQIRTAIEVGMNPSKAVVLAMESPSVTALFSDEKVLHRVIKDVESGVEISVALSKLDILSEYDQTVISVAQSSYSFESAFDAIIEQHMFIRSLGV